MITDFNVLYNTCMVNPCNYFLLTSRTNKTYYLVLKNDNDVWLHNINISKQLHDGIFDITKNQNDLLRIPKSELNTYLISIRDKKLSKI